MLVHPETGELVEPPACPDCKEKEDVIAGLQRDIRGWSARYAELCRDLNADARTHPEWDTVTRIVGKWRRACRHPKSQMTADRFWLILPFLERHGEDLIDRAIAGAAFDPMTKPRKNGSVQRFDSLELIFRSEGHFESMVNRAPRGQT